MRRMSLWELPEHPIRVKYSLDYSVVEFDHEASFRWSPIMSGIVGQRVIGWVTDLVQEVNCVSYVPTPSIVRIVQ